MSRSLLKPLTRRCYRIWADNWEVADRDTRVAGVGGLLVPYAGFDVVLDDQRFVLLEYIKYFFNISPSMHCIWQ